ncbi:unnamed protein product [Adineta steineri]|uniref:Mitochondria-eating protein n=1 Tax=Adineta steineri TaxID=433720 RepID=A0A814CI57_9BILA|nr:unnamed protein product [Adineta steineri]
MSDAINFHFIYPQQTSHTNKNHHLRKQQPANKFINSYLSTAAHYLNRTKSFHVPSNTTLTNNPNNNTCIQIDNNSQQQQSYLTNNSQLARSVPSNINNLNPPSTIYHEYQFQPVSSEIKSNKNYKSPGIVNTLRKSLRKNKERFYNKRSTTMKSCHSLSNYEQSPIILPQTSMTPTLLCRHQHIETNTRPCIPITMKYDSSINFINNNNDEEDDQMPPLQSLNSNGRNRILTSSPICPSTPFTNHQQQASILPLAASLQSLSPITPNITTSDQGNNVQQQQTINPDQEEKERLKTDLTQLKNELQKSKETIARLQKSEEQMRERLAEQAQRQLEKGGKFEDLNQISRPTELIRSYNTLYSQSRIDALDALDNIHEMSNAEDLKSKLLFSVVVLAFRHAQNHAKDIRNKIKQILQLTNDKSSIVLEETIEKYLRTTIQKYDVGKIILEVENQLWTTLYDYPRLKSCNELLKYINNACRTAWGLVNQTPPYYIEFQTIKYDKQIHERFHTSDKESETIVEYIWPCLIDGRDRACVAKGVVITDERFLSISKTISS